MSDIDEDIKTLEEIKNNLERENSLLDDELERMQREIEEKTNEPLREMTEAAEELGRLEEKAEEEERQGQIANVQDTISSM